MKLFMEPEMEVQVFAVEDVIATSGCATDGLCVTELPPV